MGSLCYCIAVSHLYLLTGELSVSYSFLIYELENLRSFPIYFHIHIYIYTYIGENILSNTSFASNLASDCVCAHVCLLGSKPSACAC